MKLIHLSDLHISSEWFVSQWGDALVAQVNDARPDITIVTGDLTMKGRRDEYERAHGFLRRIRTGSLLVVPGNHDTRNGGYLHFEEVFGTRYPTCENSSVVICGVDSSQPDSDEGRVDRSTLAQIADTLSVTDRIRILALHHHLMPTAGTGGQDRIPVDAGEVLKLCADTGIDIVLAGHGHRPCFCRDGRTQFLTAGSATLLRPGGRSYPSFNVIGIEGDTIYSQLVDVAGGWGTQTVATASVRPEAIARRSRPCVTPPLAFEVEEFRERLADDDWRLRHGTPQILDYPSARIH